MAQEPTSGVGSTAAQNGSALTAPFVLSLIAGLLIISGGGMMPAFGFAGPFGMMGGFGSNYYGMMGGFGNGGWYYGVAIIGLVTGIVVLAGAVMIYTRPRNAQSWGLVVLVFSVLSLFGMGGFFIGAVLGIVGGALAMASRSEGTPK